MNEIPQPKDGLTVMVGTQKDDRGNGKGETTEMRKRIGSQRYVIGVGRKNGQDKERVVRRVEQTKQLLPGIPDDVTLGVVTPKLPWNAFHFLSSVNRSWLQAIQRREPYHARVRSNSTETLILHKENSAYHSTAYDSVIALHSIREKRCYRLPGIPHIPTGIPRLCGCVSLDGRIYVIGGSTEETTDDGSREKGAEVYVFDVAGQRKWRRCARMQEPRHSFGCGVLDGKIYVFGGFSHGNPVRTCEMFDPKENVWSNIWPMAARRAYHQVGTFGKELFIYGGSIFGGEPSFHNFGKFNLEVYHTGKQRWTPVKPMSMPDHLKHEIVARFVAEGKFYLLTKSGIHVKSMDSESWEELQSFSCPTIANTYSNWRTRLRGRIALMVNHEIVVADDCPMPGGHAGVQLVQSQGFGAGKEMTWEILPSCLMSCTDFWLKTIEL